MCRYNRLAAYPLVATRGRRVNSKSIFRFSIPHKQCKYNWNYCIPKPEVFDSKIAGQNIFNS